ncbi:MAG: hypothetical protein AAFQ94_25085 [Bacteroidota bacterium]
MEIAMSRYVATINAMVEAFKYFLLFLVVVLVFSTVGWFGYRVFLLLMAAINHFFGFSKVLVWAVALVIVAIISFLFIGILTIFFRDLFWDFFEKRRLHRMMKKAIASSSIPSLELLVSIRHVDDIHSINPVSYKAASLLSSLYRKRLGFFPSMDRAVELEQFKSRHLPKLIIKNRQLFESEFGKLYACFLSENQFPGLRLWIRQCLVSSIRIREPFAGIRHLVYVVTSLITFNKYSYGLPAEKMFQTIDPENYVISPALFVRLCMINYWISQPDLTINFTPERQSILDEKPVLLLPAATEAEEESEAAEAFEVELVDSRDLDEESQEIEDHITPEEAVSRAQLMVDLLRKDSPLWSDPAQFFSKAIETLNQVLPYLPDGSANQRDSVFVLIGQIQAAQGMIEEFERVYLDSHSIPREEAPRWLQHALLECGMAEKDPNVVARVSCRYFFAEQFDWKDIAVQAEADLKEPSLFELGGLV